MKVTIRMTVVGMAAAVVLTQAAAAADISVVGRGIGGDRLYTEIGPVAGSAGLCPDGAAAFIEACRRSGGAVSTGPQRSAYERVTVCSPFIAGDAVRRYADRGFWAVAGSPVESVDFLLVDTTKGAEQSAVLEFADLDSSLSQEDGIAQWGRPYSTVGFGAVYAAAGSTDVPWAGRGL
jgi:hypothetical protein